MFGRNCCKKIGADSSLVDVVHADDPIWNFLRSLKIVFSWGESRVDEVLHIVIHENGGEPRKRAIFHHPKCRAPIDEIAACQRIRHRNKIIRIALLHAPKVPKRVVVVAILIRKRDESSAFKRVGHHTIVLRVNERRIHELATTAKLWSRTCTRP